MANDRRRGRRWVWLESEDLVEELRAFLGALARHYARQLLVWPLGNLCPICIELRNLEGSHDVLLDSGHKARLGLTAYSSAAYAGVAISIPEGKHHTMNVTHLDRLEAESIHIIREVIAANVKKLKISHPE